DVPDKAENQSHDRAADHTAHGIGEIPEIHPQVVPEGHGNVEHPDDDVQADKQGRDGQYPGLFDLAGRLLPVGRGKGSTERPKLAWVFCFLHKNTSFADMSLVATY